MNDKKLKSLTDILKDTIKHPEDDLQYVEDKLLKKPEFTKAEMQDLKTAYSKIINSTKLSPIEKQVYMKDSWKVNFRRKPPSPSEVLTEKWIGATAESVYPYVSKFFTDFFDPTKPYRNLIMYLPIGVGKSTIAVLMNLYISIHYYLMRDPYKFLGVSKASLIVMALIAFNQDKAYETLTKPLSNMLSTSEVFHKCKTEDILANRMKEGDPTKIYWTTAGQGAVMQIGDLRFVQISDISRLLGLSILCATATELSFFKEKAWSDEKIMRLYNDTKSRVWNRFTDNFYARTILDSSPNSMENSIDKWIVEEAVKDPTNFLLRGAKWDFQPWLYPQWEKDNSKTFPIFKGSSSNPAKIITMDEIPKYDVHDIVKMPIDLLQLAKDDLDKILKDYAGIPSGDQDKLVSPHVVDRMFCKGLLNEYSYLYCPASLPPETQLWDKIKDKYWIKTGNSENDYQFYRYPDAQRFLSVDQSYAKDWTGISVCHIEAHPKTGERMYIVDFTISIAVGPKKTDKISLEAIKFFIHCLRKYGNLKIGKVSFDSFQSRSTLEYLERYGFDAIKFSVDTDLEPYLNLIALSSRGLVKIGRNIVMKNNMKSLIMGQTKIAKKKKIDHLIGDISQEEMSNTKWETSRIGYYAKDLADSVAGCVALAEMYGTKKPQYYWENALDSDGKVRYSHTKESIYKEVENFHRLVNVRR